MPCDPCTDTDGDGYGNPGYPANTCDVDNCFTEPNLDQTDTDGDGIGDVCDGANGVDVEMVVAPGQGHNSILVDPLVFSYLDELVRAY